MKSSPAAAAAALLSLPAMLLADPVDPNAITTFQAGQPACAEDVNQTIQALITAVNDNAARVAELEAALRNAHRPLVDLVTGSTYKIYIQSSAIGEIETNTPENNAETPVVSFTEGRLGFWSFVELGTITLNSGGTASFEFDGHEREVYLDTFASHDEDSPSVPRIDTVSLSTPIDDAEIDVIPGTWSLNGQSISVVFDGDTTVFTVSPDGENLMLGEKSVENVPGAGGTLSLLEAGMGMGVRTNPPKVFVETFDGTPYPNNGPTIDFDAPQGESVFQSLRIVNLGDSDLTNMSLDITPFEGPGQIYEIVKGLDGPTLGPGEQVLITIRFTDTSTGNQYATFEIDSDDPATPTFEVNLRGF